MVQRLKRHGFRGALILGASRLLVTLVLLGGLYWPGALQNESAKLLVLGAIVGYWLGHGGESDPIEDQSAVKASANERAST